MFHLSTHGVASSRVSLKELVSGYRKSASVFIFVLKFCNSLPYPRPCKNKRKVNFVYRGKPSQTFEVLNYTILCLENILAVGNKSYETFQTFDRLIPVLATYPKEITQKGKNVICAQMIMCSYL